MNRSRTLILKVEPMPRPVIQPFTPRELGPKPWGSELLIAETPQYLGKVLSMKAGHRGGLQYHEQKDETFYLVSGSAYVRFERGSSLELITMHAGQAFHIPVGAVHQVEAITDCVFFEASTPHFDDRVNVGDQFGCADSGESW